MPNVSFCFQGYVRGAEITRVRNVNGELVDVSHMSAVTVAAKLEDGEYFISLGDYLYERHRNVNIEIHDFDSDEHEL